MMTFKTIYKDFLAIVGKHRVGTVLPAEFALVFNQAQEEVITNKLAVIELNKKVTDDLIPLIKSVKGTVMTLSTDTQYLCYQFERPAECRRVKRIAILLNGSWNAKCSLLKSVEETDVLSGVYSRPNQKQVYYKFDIISEKTYIVVYVPPLMTSVKIYLDYYSHPTRVDETMVIKDDLSCVFGNEVTVEIINAAARMYLERSQDVRNQTFNADLKHKNTNQ